MLLVWVEAMALQPLALSLLGVEEPIRRRRNGRTGEDELPTTDARSTRPSRRVLSYYNSFQTTCTSSNDEPPSYSIATKQRPVQRRHLDGGREVLPAYTCTVAAEAKVLLNIESISPLHSAAPSEWKETYMVLRGTLLSFHKVKDGGAGKLLRSYTLQHAEVGGAPDMQHETLEPRTKLAHVIPSAARRRAWMKDPDMFEQVRQYAMRLRLETDQIVLATPCEEQIHALIHAISAGIDVSCAIDERSIPRQCTVPRRRRRQRTHQPANLEDPTFLAEQERILRDMYPGFAERPEDQPGLEIGRTITTITTGTATDFPEPIPTPVREEDEIDLSAIREEDESLATPAASPRRPGFLRSITDSSVNTAYSGDMLYATSPDNFDLDTGKWRPPHTRTPQQIQRYIKRCLPILLAQSVRASDVLICNGKRVKVNLRMEMLEEWELQPPSYRSHGFTRVGEVERPVSLSRNSVEAGSVAQEGERTSTSALGKGDDRITRAEETGLANLELAKVTSLSGADKDGARGGAVVAKRRETRDPAGDMHGVVFCF